MIAVNFPISTIGEKKPEKNQGFNGIRTRDLRETGAMLYQLSYEATHWKGTKNFEQILEGLLSQKNAIFGGRGSVLLEEMDWISPSKNRGFEGRG